MQDLYTMSCFFLFWWSLGKGEKCSVFFCVILLCMIVFELELQKWKKRGGKNGKEMEKKEGVKPY